MLACGLALEGANEQRGGGAAMLRVGVPRSARELGRHEALGVGRNRRLLCRDEDRLGQGGRS